MFREGTSIEDLKSEMLLVKKEFHKVDQENYLLKVKVRKLQEEVSRKNRQIQILLDPKKSLAYRKITSEHGATMVLNLQDQNSELQKTIAEKNMVIKRLQNDLQAAMLYTMNNTERKKCLNQQTDYDVEADVREINFTIPYAHGDNDYYDYKETKSNRKHTKRKNKSSNSSEPMDSASSRAESATLSDSMSNLKQLEYEKLNHNLQKIKNIFSEDTEGTAKCNSYNGSILHTICNRKLAVTDLNNQFKYEMPHKDVEELHRYVLTMIDEVSELKSTIFNLQQEKKKDSSSNSLKSKSKENKAGSLGQVNRKKKKTYMKTNKSEADKDSILSERKGKKENNKKIKGPMPRVGSELIPVPQKINDKVKRKCDILKEQCLERKEDCVRTENRDSNDDCDLESEYI